MTSKMAAEFINGFHMTTVITLSGIPFQTMPFLFSLKPLVHAIDIGKLKVHSIKQL